MDRQTDRQTDVEKPVDGFINSAKEHPPSPLPPKKWKEFVEQLVMRPFTV